MALIIRSCNNSYALGNTLAIVIACIALITIGMTLLLFSLYAIFQVYDIRMSIDVSNHSGFNTDTERIDFGSAMPGNSNTRTIVISHDYSKPLLIHFKKSGNISAFVAAPEDFYLEPGLVKEIQVSAIIPIDAARSSYEGNLRVYFRRI